MNRLVFAAALLLLNGGRDLLGQGPALSLNAFAMRFSPEPVSEVEALPIVLRRPLALRLEHVTVGQALRAITARAGLDLAYSRAVVPLERVVSVDVDGAPVAEALRQVLRDVPVELWVSTTGKMALVPIRADDPAAGSITGHVTDARTGQGVAAARVSVAGTRLSAVTNDSGAFRIADVPPGTYTVTARRIGFVQGVRSVNVGSGEAVTVDFRLEVSATPLDAVVVTGTITATPAKEIPNPISIITSAQIEQQGITKINDLFRGDIPGVFAADYGAANQSMGATVYVRGATDLLDFPALKTYIDGIEIANSEFLNEIDPSMIDHVEIVRGPEASTMYGAQAMNGVMQVFTKRGDIRTPAHLTASTGVGAMKGQFGTGAQQEANVGVSGGTLELSYNVGATYRHEGAWTPGHYQNTYSTYGTLSLQPVHSPLRVDLTARMGTISSLSAGNEAAARAIMNGTIRPLPGVGTPVHNIYTLPQQTVGLSAHYTPRPNWQHTLTVGLDRGASGNDVIVAPTYASAGDSFPNVYSTQTARVTAAYNTALDLRLSDRASANIVAGADYWNYRDDDYQDLRSTTTVGELGNGGPGSLNVHRRRDHSAGVFTQGRLGLGDALFLTAGVRVDFSPDLPADRHNRYAAPRVGASYVFHLGPLSAKLRADYGTALKPAQPGDKAFVQFDPTYVQLASPNLLPERETGWEAGVDLYAGDAASLTVTRYRQLGHDLFYDNYGTIGEVFWQQVQNVALTRSSGWELEGMLRLVRGLRAKATYSYVESVVKGLAPDDQTGLTVGQDLPGVPHHTGALTLIGTQGRLSIATEASYVGTSVNYDQGNVFRAVFPRLGTPDDNAYAFKTLPAAYRLGLRASFDLTPRVMVYAHGENLTNRIVFDQGYIPIDQLGRTMLVGLRLR